MARAADALPLCAGEAREGASAGARDGRLFILRVSGQREGGCEWRWRRPVVAPTHAEEGNRKRGAAAIVGERVIAWQWGVIAIEPPGKRRVGVAVIRAAESGDAETEESERAGSEQGTTDVERESEAIACVAVALCCEFFLL